MMKLIVNDKQEIISYVSIGDMTDSIEFNGKVPDGFEDNFQPSFYLLQNNEITVNPNYAPPKPPIVGPGSLDKALAQLTLQTAQHKANQDKFNAQLLLQIAQMKEDK
ncbi:DUF2977 domain-containing protein [Latilactobacillus sakei]|uniref:DUF2977 domain-containing protein n=1 Tax=Latilactobacillus sakei TaxID=1599 RepID=UPI003EBDE102